MSDTDLRRQIVAGLTQHAGLSLADASMAADVAIDAAASAMQTFNTVTKPLDGFAWLNAADIGLQILSQLAAGQTEILRQQADAAGVKTGTFDAEASIKIPQ